VTRRGSRVSGLPGPTTLARRHATAGMGRGHGRARCRGPTRPRGQRAVPSRHLHRGDARWAAPALSDAGRARATQHRGQARLAPDTRAHGGFAIGAGSVRMQEQRRYYRAVNRAPIAPLPGVPGPVAAGSTFLSHGGSRQGASCVACPLRTDVRRRPLPGCGGGLTSRRV
jgi:hypothetical protein